MKLHALTSIEADDKDQKKCMWACDHLDLTDISPWCKLFQAWLSNEPLRCLACLAAAEVNPLIRAIKKANADEVLTDIESGAVYDTMSEDGQTILEAILDLKGKLK